MHHFVRRHAPVLAVVALAGAALLPTVLPGTAQAESDRLDHLHTERPVAAPGRPDPIRFDRPDLVARLHDAYTRLAFVRSLSTAPEPITPASGRAPVTGSTAPPVPVRATASTSGSCQGDVECFLACTRAHESDSAGGYAAVGSGGAYRGAYQFSQTTWDAAVAGAGWAEYVGVPPDQAPPEIQDAAAAHLYSVSGNAAWGGLC